MNQDNKNNNNIGDKKQHGTSHNKSVNTPNNKSTTNNTTNKSTSNNSHRYTHSARSPNHNVAGHSGYIKHQSSVSGAGHSGHIKHQSSVNGGSTTGSIGQGGGYVNRSRYMPNNARGGGSYKKNNTFSKPGVNGANKRTGRGYHKKPGTYQRAYQYPYSKVVLTKRVDKVVSGGRNSSFVAIVVVGNGIDRVGVGTGTSKTIVEAIVHAKHQAMNRVIIPGKIKYLKHKFCSSIVILKQSNMAVIRAAGYISTIFKACGMKNVSCKLVRSMNTMNAIYAVFDALTQHIQKKRNIITLRQNLKSKSESIDLKEHKD